MSKIALTPNGSGTGTFTLASPNSNTSRAITLPDVDGELLTSTGDGSALTGVVSPVKAWVKFNGTGAVAVISSFNVSSITDNGTGLYTVNFTTALASADYVLSGVARRPTTDDQTGVVLPRLGTSPTTTAVQFATLGGGASKVDMNEVHIIVVGG